MFSCACWPSGCLLQKSVCPCLLPISSLDYLFFWVWSLVSSLQILDTSPLSNVSFANIFSHSIGCLLVLLIVSFAVQKLIIFMRSQQFIFAFNSLAFGDVSSKKLLRLMPEVREVFSCFLLQGLDGFLSHIQVLYPFEFIFVNGVRKWSSFILLHVVSSSPSTIC